MGIVATVIGDDELYAEWKAEMGMMSGRIKNVRTLLQEELEKRMPEKDWSFVTSQIGMFSYTGLSKEQCSTCGTSGTSTSPSTGALASRGCRPTRRLTSQMLSWTRSRRSTNMPHYKAQTTQFRAHCLAYPAPAGERDFRV